MRRKARGAASDKAYDRRRAKQAETRKQHVDKYANQSKTNDNQRNQR